MFDQSGVPSAISVSIVVYHPDTGLLDLTLRSLAEAFARLPVDERVELFIVDNGGGESVRPKLESMVRPNVQVRFLTGHGNVGYGEGHNLAISKASSHYHLILNPDVDLQSDALANAIAFFASNPAAGLITPWIGDDDGAQQFLCRRFPTVLDLFLRGFVPGGLRRLFTVRLARYEMRDVIGERNVVWDPPIVSGCFMLFRTDVLRKLNGFDPRYFLYFEDYDLTLRTHKIARVAYVPTVRVLHHGGDAARKGFTHIKLFATSAFRFFNRFGWKWL